MSRCQPHSRLALPHAAFVLALAASAAWADGGLFPRKMPPIAAAPAAAVGASAPTGLDQSFLLLPALDIERVAGAPDTPIRVGDSIHLKVEGVPAPSGGGAAPSSDTLILEIPPGEEKLLDQGWVVEPEDSGTVPGDPAQRVGKYWFKATPLKKGPLKIPSLAVRLKDGVAVARTNPLSLEVTSSLKPPTAPPGSPEEKKAQEPADFRPPMGLGFPLAMVIALGVLGAIVLAALLYGLYRLGRKLFARRPVPASSGPPRTDDELAMDALTDLEKQGKLQKGEFKFHYFKVSEILKAYVGARFRCDALESTTRELIDILESPETRGSRDAVRPEVLDRLESLFQKLDRVKFTDHVPELDEAEKVIPAAREFVLATRKPSSLIPETVQEGGTSASR